MSDEKKPQGSGWFALTCGLVFGAVGVAAFLYKPVAIPREFIAGAWFVCVSGILVAWGANRIRKGSKDATIGMETIKLVLALVVGSVALLNFLYPNGIAGG